MIGRRFGLAPEPPEILKRVDRAILAAERHALMVDTWAWPELDGVDPAEVVIEPWHPNQAVTEFLERYRRLSHR